MQRLAILGSTGSIGTSTLEVVRESGGQLRVWGLAAGRNLEALAAQAEEFRPQLVSVATAEDAERLERMIALRLPAGRRPAVHFGPAGNVAAATAEEVDTLVSAAVGVAGLEATYEAARCGKRIALANKEVLVAAGELVMEAARRSGALLLPVDSEHNGLHQCLQAGNRQQVRRLILTASGGPFRDTPREAMADVTPQQALRHPTWNMGPRITINSATLMNKGFEVIEACRLFGFKPEQIDVLIHPQSSVHALVEFEDGSILAQISVTDMKMPIQYALYYPERKPCPDSRRLDWKTVRQWVFEPPDRDRFPALDLAYEALRIGGSAGCTLNAADEVAVAAFLNGEIRFPAMAQVARETLASEPSRQPRSIEEVLEVDRRSRERARQILPAVAGAVAVVER